MTQSVIWGFIWCTGQTSNNKRDEHLVVRISSCQWHKVGLCHIQMNNYKFTLYYWLKLLHKLSFNLGLTKSFHSKVFVSISNLIFVHWNRWLYIQKSWWSTGKTIWFSAKTIYVVHSKLIQINDSSFL